MPCKWRYVTQNTFILKAKLLILMKFLIMLVDFRNAAPNYNETPLKVFENA